MKFSRWFKNKKEVWIINAGKRKIDLLRLEADFSSKKVIIKKRIIQEKIDGDFSSEFILEFIDQSLKRARKGSGLILNFEKPLFKSSVSGFSVIRENPNALIDETELENLVLNLVWRLYDRDRPLAARSLQTGETETVLVSSKIKEPAIENHHIINPLGFPGRRIGFVFENTYGRKNFWAKISNIIRSRNMEILAAAEDLSFLNKSLIAFEKEGIFVNVGIERSQVGICGRLLSDFQFFDWGEINLKKAICGSLLISLESATKLKEKYEQGKLSERSRRWLEKLFAAELKLFVDGVALAIKEFSVSAKDLPPRICLFGDMAVFPKLADFLRDYEWPKSVFYRRPSVEICSPSGIFDKINLIVENRSRIKWEDSAALVSAISFLFLSEPDYPELDKILKRRLRWLNNK